MILGRHRHHRYQWVALIAVLSIVLAACSSANNSSKSTTTKGATATTASTPHQGGSLTVLEGSSIFGSWPGLDPATDTNDSANHDYLNAIYGELFAQGPNGVIPDLATSYKLSKNLMTLDIYLRKGVKFSDGTPFNASAVVFNIKRDLSPKYPCICDSNFPISSITSPDPYTVVLQLSHPFAPIVHSFFGEAPNWIVSPTALSKMGEKAFSLKPVGAGPFEVVSDSPSTLLKLKRNPSYWQAGHPYLDTLSFRSIGTDQSAYDAMLAGQAQAYEDLSTYSLIPEAKKHFQLTAVLPSTVGPDAVQFNTTRAPFNNITAREAIYYATDPAPINKALFDNLGVPVQSITGPGDLAYEPKVPGYRTYNLAKAKALVQQLGGLSVNLMTGSSDTSLASALESQWAQAGIKTTLVPVNLPAEIQNYHSNNWEANIALPGGFDPALGLGLNFYFDSHAPFTGVHDPKLDSLIAQGSATDNVQARTAIYHQVFEYMSQQALVAILFFVPLYNVANHTVSGPGLSTNAPEIAWADVSVS